MDEIRQYILTVICVAILCGIIQLSFSGKNSTSSTARLITGLVLTATVIAPLMHMNLLDPNTFLDSISVDGQWAIAEGEQAAEMQLTACIKDETESYILGKANEWGMQVQAEVAVTDGTPPTPESVTITGIVSPYGKMQLTRCIKDDLGIAEENQIWIS